MSAHCATCSCGAATPAAPACTCGPWTVEGDPIFRTSRGSWHKGSCPLHIPGAATPAAPEARIDLATLAEAIRLWYVEVGRNPVTGSYDQPRASWLIHRYEALRAALGDSHE